MERTVNGQVKPCCQIPENLEQRDSGRADMILRVCLVCGCRHREVTIDPLQVGVRGAGL